jgi:hypothetical protein
VYNGSMNNMYCLLSTDEFNAVNLQLETIVLDLLLTIPTSQLEILRATSSNELIVYHSTFGRWVRNNFDLWSAGSVTGEIYAKAQLRLTKEDRDALSVDNHPCHADNFSGAIIRRLWEKLQ